MLHIRLLGVVMVSWCAVFCRPLRGLHGQKEGGGAVCPFLFHSLTRPTRLNLRSTCMYCHVTHINVGPACLNGCPASTKTMKPQLRRKKKVVSGTVAYSQGAVLAHGASWAKGESLHCARTARTLRATFRLCSPRRAPKHTPWKPP